MAYEMRISDWSSDVCSSDLRLGCECARSRAVGRWKCHETQSAPDLRHAFGAVDTYRLRANRRALGAGLVGHGGDRCTWRSVDRDPALSCSRVRLACDAYRLAGPSPIRWSLVITLFQDLRGMVVHRLCFAIAA